MIDCNDTYIHTHIYVYIHSYTYINVTKSIRCSILSHLSLYYVNCLSIKLEKNGTTHWNLSHGMVLIFNGHILRTSELKDP